MTDPVKIEVVKPTGSMDNLCPLWGVKDYLKLCRGWP